jgi:hypothetical protein
MQGHYPARFTREMGCTEAEWLMWLPAAVAQSRLEPVYGQVEVPAAGGCLTLHWRMLPPRRIALISLPRLEVTFDFEGSDEAARQVFMRRFDLHMQRGGG